jgi:osmotically-inducible protein OsmY
MLHKTPVSDTAITQQAHHMLTTHGFRAPCNIEVQTSRGVVTLSGTIEFDHQRIAILRVIHQIDGVSYVNDRMQVQPKTPSWK